MSRKTNRKGRNKDTFVMLRHDIMDSPNWLSLKPVSRCTWLEIMRRYNGHNNGEIPLSCREVAQRLGVTKDTASRAFQELLTKGFIKIARNSGFNMKNRTSRRWILTHEALNGKAPTNEWRDSKIT